MTTPDSMLELEALLDPARLAAAWQIARERPATVRDVDEVDDAVGAFDEGSEEASSETFAAEATDPGEPARDAPLPLGVAHHQLLDEIEHTLAAVPAIAAKARRVLVTPLAQLVQALEPIDRAAAELALDQLEDLWQALLADAGWPKIADRSEA